jgi:hypothetical protein
MTELKTLRELADEVGFPFDAIDTTKEIFHCLGISPQGFSVGWEEDGSPRHRQSAVRIWTLVPKKKVLKSFVYQCLNGGSFYAYVTYIKDPENWCELNRAKLIKILDEIEVDE